MAETCIVRLEIVYFIGTRSQILFEMLFPSVISLDNLYLLDTKQNVFLDIIQIKFPQKTIFFWYKNASPQSCPRHTLLLDDI